MALATWPGTLPFKTHMRRQRPEPYRPPTVTEVEDGPELMVVQSQTIIEKIAYSIEMTGTQFAAFRTFVRDTLKQGTSQFLMTVPVPGTGYVQRRVYLMGGTYQADEAGSTYTVAFTLCVFPTV